MLRRSFGLSLSALVVAGSLLAAGPAEADCPQGDGTLPDSSSTVYRVGTGDATPYTTIYVDDRDYPDLDEDNDAAGIYLYLESNGVAGLQRGGVHPAGVVEQEVYGALVRILQPTPILPPNPGGLPVFPNGLTLFPDGFGGNGPPPAFWWEDWCRTDESGAAWPGEPDQLLL